MTVIVIIVIKKFKIVVRQLDFLKMKKIPHTVTIVLYQKDGKLDKTDFVSSKVGVSSIKKQSKIFDVKKIEKVTKQRI